MNSEQRLDELEVKLAFQDDLLEALNATVARQQQEIDLLQQQLRVLYNQFRASQPDGQGSGHSLRDEIPPHY
ncbi:SlyX family protein [uncultured Aquitalea sp.]|uniref:SlyX family protein n=1 Tax=uncultured Aquitalea sp. TaxID=540272 RepID=UPI0025D34B52|nr:SlyX family protein [uncultured Aquitalea sp.]